MSLSLQFLSALVISFLEGNLSARGTPFMGLIYARHTLQISRQVYMYKYVIVSTDSFSNQFKTIRIHERSF